jgi:hypothetical protein
VGQGGGIEDRMAAMDHMIVEVESSALVGDNTAENAGIHRVKVNRWNGQRLRRCLINPNPSFFALDMKD